MVRDYILLFVFGAPVAAVVCLFAGQWGLTLAIGGVYYAAYRLVKRVLLSLGAAVSLLAGAVRARRTRQAT